MEIKGSAVKTIPDYLKKYHPEKYNQWLDTLPEQSKKVFAVPVMASDWYSLHDAGIVPTEALGQLLFSDAVKGAWQCGRFSAEIALNGIYKFFTKAATPGFIIDRAGRVLATYYQPCKMEAVTKADDHVVLHITQFEEPSNLVEARICGWIERAMEIHGVRFVNVTIEKSLTRGDAYTEILVKWGYEKR
jgi:hypothetical protein